MCTNLVVNRTSKASNEQHILDNQEPPWDVITVQASARAREWSSIVIKRCLHSLFIRNAWLCAICSACGKLEAIFSAIAISPCNSSSFEFGERLHCRFYFCARCRNSSRVSRCIYVYCNGQSLSLFFRVPSVTRILL